MDNFIAIAIICVIVGSAACYIYRQKKKKVKCIGCPYAKECNKSKITGDISVNLK